VEHGVARPHPSQPNDSTHTPDCSIGLYLTVRSPKAAALALLLDLESTSSPPDLPASRCQTRYPHSLLQITLGSPRDSCHSLVSYCHCSELRGEVPDTPILLTLIPVIPDTEKEILPVHPRNKSASLDISILGLTWFPCLDLPLRQHTVGCVCVGASESFRSVLFVTHGRYCNWKGKAWREEEEPKYREREEKTHTSGFTLLMLGHPIKTSTITTYLV
jgi:hypothetical protein